MMCQNSKQKWTILSKTKNKTKQKWTHTPKRIVVSNSLSEIEAPHEKLKREPRTTASLTQTHQPKSRSGSHWFTNQKLIKVTLGCRLLVLLALPPSIYIYRRILLPCDPIHIISRLISYNINILTSNIFCW